MWIFLPLTTVLAIAFILVRISEPVQKSTARGTLTRLHHELDLAGFMLFTPSCVMFLLAMSWGGSKFPWKSAVTIGLLVSSFVLAIISMIWMRYRKERALLPPHILLKPVVLYANLTMFLQGGVFLMMQFYLPLWFQSVKRASPEDSGIMMLPTCLAQIVASVCCGIACKPRFSVLQPQRLILLRFFWLFTVRWVPYAPVWGVFGVVCTAVGTGLMTTFQPTTSSAKWIGYQIVVGVGRGFSMQLVRSLLSWLLIPILAKLL